MEVLSLISGKDYTLAQALGPVDLTGTGCSHWLSPTGNYGLFTYDNYACYAPFATLPDKKRVSLYIGLDEPEYYYNELLFEEPWAMGLVDPKQGYRRWLEWLVQRSPHAPAIVQGNELKYSSFVEMNVDAGGLLVHHTACALRIHQEHRSVPWLWMLYVELGMEEDLAYLLSLQTIIRRVGKGRYIEPGMMVSHSAISSAQSTCMAGFLLRIYNTNIPSWRESSKYTGHGAMWDDGRKHKAHHFDQNILFPKPKGKVSSDPFRQPPSRNYPFTVEGVSEFVETARVEIPKLWGVKLIDNPETTGVKYEKA